MANINKNKKFHYIYKTTNLLNGEFYIGMHSTSNINDGYVGSGKRLRRSIRKYGLENFNCEILEYLPNRESLVKKEIELVNKDLLKDNKCINLMCGGNGGFISVEQQAYRSSCGGKALKKKFDSDENLRFEISSRASKIMKKNNLDGKMKYDNFTGKKHSDESKQKIKAKAKLKFGNKNSQFGSCWINNGIENKKIKKELLNEYPEWKLGRLPIGNIGRNQFIKQ